jgi:hypothetical protein
MPRAQNLRTFLPPTNSGTFCKFGAEGSVGSPLGETAVMPKGRCLSQFSHFRHGKNPFKEQVLIRPGIPDLKRQEGILP